MLKIANDVTAAVACGLLMIDEAEKFTEFLKHQRWLILHLLAFDPTIPNWYVRLGWTHIGEDELFGHPVAVMRYAPNNPT